MKRKSKLDNDSYLFDLEKIRVFPENPRATVSGALDPGRDTQRLPCSDPSPLPHDGVSSDTSIFSRKLSPGLTFFGHITVGICSPLLTSNQSENVLC